jgi:hypothetical protein
MRSHRVPFVYGLAAVAALAGCSSAGTITVGNSVTDRSDTGANDKTGGTGTSGIGTGGSNDAAGGIVPQPSASKSSAPGGKSASKWVISMPSSVVGDPPVSENSGLIPQEEAAMRSDLSSLGVSGQSVHAANDDGNDGLYLLIYGINGEGFNPTF